MELTRPAWFAYALNTLLAGNDLAPELVLAAVRDLVGGRVDDAFATAFLVALRAKGETPIEIATAAMVLREQMVRLVPVSGPVLDTCGTGGDDSGTFNISTATAFVVAAAGVPVVKHGNRAVSSRSGSADVLRELGVPIESGVPWAQKCLERIGFAFCFAPQFHPGMAHVAKLRRLLGIRTIFNLLGPLSNPASADFQLLGVGKSELLDPLAGAIAHLGIRRAILVCSDDGLDEVSLGAPTQVRIVVGHQFRSEVWEPSLFGLGEVRLDQVKADGAAQSAQIIRSVLADEPTPARTLVVANTAAAFFAAGKVATIPEGVALAQSTLQSGTPKRVLDQLVNLG